MYMIEQYVALLEKADFKLIIFLGLVVFGTLIDFVVGVMMAKFSPDITFSSSQLKKGLMVKIAIVILCFYLVPIALAFEQIGLSALYIVYSGFIFADLTSIVGHIYGNTDNKEHQGVLDLIKELFMKK